MTMQDLFNHCVQILEAIAHCCGISYEAANIWIFVVIHPALTLLFLGLFLVYRRKWRRLKGAASQAVLEK